MNMDFRNVAMDLRVWLAVALILGIVLEPVTDKYSEIIIVTLMIQMILSMDGLVYRKKSFAKKKNLLHAVITCYVINTIITILIGALFLQQHKDIWYGFAMIAAMPCAVAVITGTVLKNNDLNDGVAVVTFNYILALIISPVLSFALIGDAVNPLEILKYIILFIVVPIIVTRFTTKLEIKRETKVPIINLTMALLMFLCMNRAKAEITNDITLALLVLGAMALRILILHVLAVTYIRKTDINPSNETTFHVMTVWKNTGLSISMCIILLSGVPSAIIPGVMTIIVENIWFSWIVRKKYTCIPERRALLTE